MEDIAAHEESLRDYARERLVGPELAEPAGHDGRQGGDLLLHAGRGGACARHLDRARQEGRRGAGGAPLRGPLMEHLGLTATCRASFGLYNTDAEVDALVDALELCHELFA